MPRRTLSIGVRVALGAMLALTSCTSEYITIAPRPPANYELLGQASGEATGSLGILGTAYYFIPMALNSRSERAYQRAVESVPGATGLIDVTYQESWYWWFIGTAHTVKVTGQAIQEVRE